MKSENVVVNTGRVEKLRSRKPNLVKFVRKVEPTEEELDYMRYFVNIWLSFIRITFRVTHSSLCILPSNWDDVRTVILLVFCLHLPWCIGQLLGHWGLEGFLTQAKLHGSLLDDSRRQSDLGWERNLGAFWNGISHLLGNLFPFGFATCIVFDFHV